MNSIPYPENFLFYMGVIVSIVWPSLVPPAYR